MVALYHAQAGLIPLPTPCWPAVTLHLTFRARSTLSRNGLKHGLLAKRPGHLTRGEAQTSCGEKPFNGKLGVMKCSSESTVALMNIRVSRWHRCCGSQEPFWTLFSFSHVSPSCPLQLPRQRGRNTQARTHKGASLLLQASTKLTLPPRAPPCCPLRMNCWMFVASGTLFPIISLLRDTLCCCE